MDLKNFNLIAEIEKNISDEATAREGYFNLLNIMPDEDKAIINEIISDEMNHSDKLKALVEKYSSIKSAIS